MVGAVVVAGNRIVGEGYHRRAGGPHAEVIALEAAGARTRGATLYLTLEPCQHTDKRTPPCVPRILQSRIARVVIAMPDPNPQVGGRGIRRLQQAGVSVDVGCLRKEAEQLNEAYVHYMRTGRPFVILKAALTLDGKIATATGESQWITGEQARRYVHRMRSEADAIMVGIGTVLRDDPRLTARRQGRTTSGGPARVILDSTLRIALSARVLQKPGDPILITTRQASAQKIKRLQKAGASVLVLPSDRGRVSFPASLRALAKRGITSVLLEGGSELNAAAMRTGTINRVALFVAPLLLGGQDAKSVIGGKSPSGLAQAVTIEDATVRRLGRDLLIEGRVAKT